MKHDSIGSASSAVTATATAIINSFMITNSIIITVIVTASILLAVLMQGE